MKLSGNTVLVTGGTRGIGLALARTFFQNNNTVIVTGRNETTLEEAKNSGLIPFRCDLSSSEDIEQLSVFIQHEHPDLNILVNNAGIQFNYSFLEETNPIRRVETEINTNFTSQIRLITLLLPVLVVQKEAAIVNVTSALSINPREDGIVYSATKAAFRSFTRGLRYQLEKTPVKVIELVPPLVETDMTKGRGKNKISPGELAKIFTRQFHKGRWYITTGKIRLYGKINQFFPSLAAKMLRG